MPALKIVRLFVVNKKDLSSFVTQVSGHQSHTSAQSLSAL